MGQMYLQGFEGGRATSAAIHKLGVLTLFLLPLAAQEPEYEVPEDADRVEIYRTVDNHNLRVWIYEPEGHNRSAKAPAIVSIFGGGFRGGHPGRRAAELARYLAKRGIVGIVPDYRVRNRHGVDATECVVDAKAVVRWVRANAQDLGVDPDRVAAGGGSAGGYLAAATATIPGYDAPDTDLSASAIPNALALHCPPVIVPWDEMEGERLERVRDIIGAPFESMSPYHHLTKDLPPTIIFQTTEDPIVDYNTVERFCEKAKNLGAQCDVVLYEAATHCPAGEDATDSLRRTAAFFASLGWIEVSSEE